MKRLLLVFLILTSYAFAQETNLQQALPVDPNVRIGKLENGLEYWIRSHKTPPGKIGMWLHVGSGSLNEEENQRGLAHFLEHMAFNGTEHYPPGTLIKYYESIGLKFGRHQNAFTSFDQTTYLLSLPDTKEETVRNGLETFADYAFRILLIPEEIEKERPIIVEEARARKGVGQRLLEKTLAALLPGSRLANRLPIGKEEVIQKADRNAFQDYYRKWYRPDNSILLVVGDLSPSIVEELIRKEFGDWKKIPNPPANANSGIRPYEKAQAAIITDPELTTAEISVMRISELQNLQTVGQFRKELIEDLASVMMNRRLLALVEEGKAPYQDASVNVAPFQNAAVIQEAEASGAPEQWKPVLNSLLTEVKRARDFGFLQAELEDAKKETLAGAEQAERTEATWDANTFLSRMNSAFSQGRKPMSQTQSLQLTRALLPGITMQEVSDSFRKNFSAESRFLLIKLPEKQGMPVATEKEILEETTRMEASTLSALEQKERPRTLLEKEPEPGAIAEQEEDAETKILSATLTNGIRIHLREMDFKKNSVSALIRLAGGEVRETTENRGITQAATLALAQPATRKFSSTSIREFMTGKNVTVSGFGSGDGVALMIAGSPDDFEEGFRLSYLLLTEPKVEEAALKVLQDQTLQAIEQIKTSVEEQASEKYLELISGKDPRLKFPTAEQIKKIRGAEAQKWLESLIAQAPVEVAIIGDMDRDRMLKLALKYLGALPKRPRTDPELAKLRQIQVKEGPLEAKIEVSTITPRGFVLTGWRGANLNEVKDRRVLDLSAEILSSRMQSEIREKRGLTYSIECSSSPATSYPEMGFFGTDFSADPGKVEEAAKVAEQMMLEFVQNGPTEAEMQTVRNQMKNIIETQQKEPGYWVRVLSELDYRGIKLSDVKSLVQQITSYSREDIMAALKKYVQPSRQIEVIALPKEVPKQ
ncbi:insulinase family protein [bacterium]|nr:insulinase family protein [bacterium]MCI0606428.1 insulinase family protein [bacterium]